MCYVLGGVCAFKIKMKTLLTIFKILTLISWIYLFMLMTEVNHVYGIVACMILLIYFILSDTTEPI